MATMTSGNHPAVGGRTLVRAAVTDIARLARISRVLARHGFGHFAMRAGVRREDVQEEVGEASVVEVDVRRDPKDAARRFCAMLQELGPTFVKVGQILSTRPDLLPPPFIAELARLHDKVSPLPAEQIRAAVEAGLGRPVSELYAEFGETPLASASMAQAHLATLPDGTEVVVKVQRPGIADTIRSDLDLLHLFARVLEVTIAEMELYAPGDIVRALDEAISTELDFEHEADNLRQFAENFAGDPGVKIPALFESHTCRTVLTLERIRGQKVDVIEPRSDRAERVVNNLISAAYQSVFRHGLFHGDPHPGNLFVLDDDRIAFIDFGLCGSLSRSQQDSLVTLIVSVVSGDIDGLARILLRMGRPLGHIHMGAFKSEIGEIRERYFHHSLKNIDASRFIDECLDASQRYRIRIAPEYSILMKSVATMEGIIRRAAPELDLRQLGEEYARKLLSERYSAERLMAGTVAGAMHLGNFLREVPEQLSQILMDVEGGTLQMRVENEGLKHLGEHLNTMTTRLFMAFCCAGLIVATPLTLAVEPLWFHGFPVATILCGASAAVIAFWGIVWHLLGGRLRKIPVSPLLRLIRRR